MVSFPTRLYRYLKIPVYLLALLHIPVQLFVYKNQTYYLLQIIIGSAVGLTGILLLYTGLKFLGNSFMPCYSGILPEQSVTDGPYKYCKHPIYYSNIIQLIAVMILAPGPIVFIIFGIILWIYYFTIKDENRYLNQHFSKKK